MIVETRTGPDDRPAGTPTGISVAAGSVALVLAAVLSAALFPPDAVAARLVIPAAVVAGYAALVADPRAVLSVSLLSVLVFTGFLANRYGELSTVHGDVWWYALVFGGAALLGTGCRTVRQPSVPGPTSRRGTPTR